MSAELTEKDDGSAEWAAEQAAGLIGLAFYRAAQESRYDAAELVLSLADSARSHLTTEDWKLIGSVST